MATRLILLCLLCCSPAWAQAPSQILALDFSGSKPGQYALIVTVNADGSLVWRSTPIITFGGGSGGGSPPITQPPITQPPVVQPPLTGVAAKSAQWLKLVDYPEVKADSLKLATVYEQIADEIRDGKIKTEFALISRQLEITTDSLGEVYRLQWRPFTVQLGDYLTAEKIAGRLGDGKTVKPHEPIWRAVATGLRSGSK